MLASFSSPIPPTACHFAGKSITPPSDSVRFRRARPVAISSAYAAAAATSSCNSTCLNLAPSLYGDLGISIGATSGEVKSAYRRLDRICHPDVAAVDRKSSSTDEFMKIHAAYSTLSDPDKRAAYDRRLFSMRRSIGLSSVSTPMMSRFSGYAGRNWETDQCW